jgi:hypothetical protein
LNLQVAGSLKQSACDGSTLLVEIVEFDAFAEEYGPTGNWHPDDHMEFLRVLKQHRGDYSATVISCCDSMLGFDRLDIIAHARWHANYEELAMRKKLALVNWRQSKEIAAEAARKEASSQIAVKQDFCCVDPSQCDANLLFSKTLVQMSMLGQA